MEKVNLFCLPFAGGTQYSYASFQDYCPPGIELTFLELPGRGKRLEETCLTNVHEMAEDLLSVIRPRLESPYALYGHSLGALLAYLLTQEIADESGPLPEWLIVTGRRGPSVRRDQPKKYLLPKEAFIEKLREMGGMSRILENSELMEFFEPILRADLEAAETYVYEEASPMPVPISAMIGQDEAVTEAEAMAWQKETIFPVELKCFPGNHFFIFDQPEKIMEEITEKLLP